MRNTQPDQTKLTERVKVWNRAVGCAHSYTKRTFETFGPLQQDVVSEDAAINFRSWALGPVLFIEEPLVLYRIHDNALSSQSGNLSDEKALASYARLQEARYATFKQYLIDISHPVIRAKTEPAHYLEARRWLVEQLRATHYKTEFARTRSRMARLKLLREHLSLFSGLKATAIMALRCLFPSLDLWNIRRQRRML